MLLTVSAGHYKSHYQNSKEITFLVIHNASRTTWRKATIFMYAVVYLSLVKNGLDGWLHKRALPIFMEASNGVCGGYSRLQALPTFIIDALNKIEKQQTAIAWLKETSVKCNVKDQHNVENEDVCSCSSVDESMGPYLADLYRH